MYIIHSCKQATTVSVYTLRLIFCFSSLHTTGTKSTTFTAELFVYNPKHYLFAISIGPIMSACQCCIHFGERDIRAGQYVTLPGEIPGCKVLVFYTKKGTVSVNACWFTYFWHLPWEIILGNSASANRKRSGIRRSEVRFLMGTLNFFLCPTLVTRRKHLSPGRKLSDITSKMSTAYTYSWGIEKNKA